MSQVTKSVRKYTLFWAVYVNEESYKRFSEKCLKGTRPKSSLFEWITQIEEKHYLEGFALTNCGVVED